MTKTEARLRQELKDAKAECADLRTANCENCRYGYEDDVCTNPVDQCGVGERLMWAKRGANNDQD